MAWVTRHFKVFRHWRVEKGYCNREAKPLSDVFGKTAYQQLLQIFKK